MRPSVTVKAFFYHMKQRGEQTMQRLPTSLICRLFVCLVIGSYLLTLFFLIRMLFFRPWLNILSSADFRLKIFQYYSQFIAHDISILDHIGGISYSQCMFSRFVAQFSRLENRISGKHIIVLYLQLLNTKIYPFQYLSLGFILKILRISALIFL